MKSGKRIKVFDKEKEMEIPESILSFKNNVNRLAEIDELLAKVKVVDKTVPRLIQKKDLKSA